MSFLNWMTVAGALLLWIALSSALLRRLFISTSSVYLAVGLALSPLGVSWLHVTLTKDSRWFEYLCQVAVIISLFIGGLKLRLPFSAPAWRTVPRLAGPIMLLTIAGLSLFAWSALHLALPIALVLGAVLAPTDPVLASAVSVNEAADRDRMRYGLSGEAGLNDGMAFPFVVFAVDWLSHRGAGPWIFEWVLVRVLWATPVALLSGYFMGKHVGHLATWMRTRHGDTNAPSDFLALALIALSYSVAELLGAWGFLAVFAAGVGLRSAERTIVMRSPHPDAAAERPSSEHPPAEDLVTPKAHVDAVEQPAVAVGVMVAETLTFGSTAERLFELTLVVLVGAALASHWDARAIPVSIFLFVVLRPLSAQLLLVGTPTTFVQRWLMGWFGVRGIGSLYYVAFVLVHAPDLPALADVTNITLSVVALSILAHGVSVQPLLSLYERSLERRRARAHKRGERSSELGLPKSAWSQSKRQQTKQ